MPAGSASFRPDQWDRPLPPARVAEVLDLAGRAATVDGSYPLAEDAVLGLRQAEPPAPVHLLVSGPSGGLAGYAQLGRDTGELVVRPEFRRRGIGRALATAARAVVAAADPPRPLRLWSHGDHPDAAGLARSLGFTRNRVLLRLGRSLADLPVRRLPDGVTIRPFRPGADDPAWLAVNARAFADHPEQGRWTTRELRLRLAAPWFDPAGFLLAVRAGDGRLLGFHWTKTHPGSPGQPEPIGEVYVLGVDPDAQGLGLGAALTLAGLWHLRERGLDRVMLYVEESNRAALALYTRLGFTRWSIDVGYTDEGRPDPGS